MSKNWFAGLQKSRGTWVCFVGSDDGIVSSNLTKFIDLIELYNEEKVLVNHTVAFHYKTSDRGASINVPSSYPTKKLIRIKWPIKLAALFPQFFYDMPQPYSKAIINKKILEPLLNHENEIPGASPDVFLGNYVAMKTRNGLFFDELLTIRGNSILSIGAQIHSRKFTTATAHELISDTNSKDLPQNLGAFFDYSCRPASSLDHFIYSRNKLGKKERNFSKLGKTWCDLTCLDKSHHKPIWNKLMFITKIIYFLGLLSRKFWYMKNFGIGIPKDCKEIVSSENNIVTIAKYFSEKFSKN
jgi:hypothetical protein